jgi:hypothetical protein
VRRKATLEASEGVGKEQGWKGGGGLARKAGFGDAGGSVGWRTGNGEDDESRFDFWEGVSVHIDVGWSSAQLGQLALRACARRVRQRRATARGWAGPRPVRGLAPGRGAVGLGSGGAPTEVQVHREASEGPYTGGLGGPALWSASAREYRSRHQFSTSFSLLPNCETPKSVN